MKTIEKYRISLAIFCCVAFIPANAQVDDNSNKEEVEKNTDVFRLDYFSKDKNSFYMVKAMIKDGTIELDEDSEITEVPGKLPYPTGSFRINVLDSQGEVIAAYNIQDPLTVRSCDEDSSVVSPSSRGTVYLPLPKSSDIAKLEFMKEKKIIGILDLSELFRKFIGNEKDGDAKNKNRE